MTTVLVDIDGTVSLMDGARGPYDWHLVHLDKPNYPVIAAVTALHHAGHRIVFASGRKEQGRDATYTWLARFFPTLRDIPLFMRADDDNRDDTILKAELYETEIEPRYGRPLIVFDDRNKVVNMWRTKFGLTVFQVAEGDF